MTRKSEDLPEKYETDGVGHYVEEIFKQFNMPDILVGYKKVYNLKCIGLVKRFLQGNADLQIILWVKMGNPRIEILSAVDFLRLLSLRVGSLFGDVRLRRLKKFPLKSCFTYRRCVSGIPAA